MLAAALPSIKRSSSSAIPILQTADEKSMNQPQVSSGAAFFQAELYISLVMLTQSSM
jgi:hypothetical protein